MDRFVVIRPAVDSIYRDILRCDSKIEPTSLGTIWYPEPISVPVLASASPNLAGTLERRRVFLHLHGGAFVIGSARDPDTRNACTAPICASTAASPARTWVFCPEYRLSSHPGGRFPAPLQDAVTAYAYLTRTLRIPPRDIVISGDSAGGTLAIALLRYVVEHQDGLPGAGESKGLIGGVLLWSPWPDMVLTVEEALHRLEVAVDLVPPLFIRWAHRDFLPGDEANVQIIRENPYLLSNRSAIRTRVAIWIQWGDAEVLREEIEKLVTVQKTVKDVRLGLCNVPHAPDDIFLTGRLLGCGKEAKEVVDDAMRFLNDNNPST